MAIREELDLNSSPFLSKLKSADNAVVAWAGKFAATAKKFPAIFAALGTVGAGASAAIFGMKKALDLGGELEDLRGQTGQTEGDLLILRQAFINAGLGADSTGELVNKLQKALGGTSLATLSSVEQIAQLQKLFAALPTPADRAAKAFELFGKSGGKMLRILNDPAALGVAKQQVGGLAGTMEKSAADMDALGDAIGGLQTKQQQFFATMLSGALPQFSASVEKLNALDLTHLGETAGKAAALIVSAATTLASAIDTINTKFDKLLDRLLGKQAPELSRALTPEEREKAAQARRVASSTASLDSMKTIPLSNLGRRGLDVFSNRTIGLDVSRKSLSVLEQIARNTSGGQLAPARPIAAPAA